MEQGQGDSAELRRKSPWVGHIKLSAVIACFLIFFLLFFFHNHLKAHILKCLNML